MKSVEQTTWLAGLEQRVENHIEQAIQTFQNVEEGTLQKPSSSGGWNVAQCLAHLNSYGQYYLPRLKHGLASQPPNERPAGTFTPSWLGTYLTKLMDPRTGRTKFKAARRHLPADRLPAYAVVAEFIDQQEELLRLLREVQGRDLKAVKIPLSVAAWIRLPLGDVLHFLIVHTERHLLQAGRNLPAA